MFKTFGRAFEYLGSVFMEFGASFSHLFGARAEDSIRRLQERRIKSRQMTDSEKIAQDWQKVMGDFDKAQDSTRAREDWKLWEHYIDEDR